MYPYSALVGFNAFYSQGQMQTVNKLPGQNVRYHPYGPSTKQSHFDTSLFEAKACEYQLPNYRNHSKLEQHISDFQGHRQMPGNQGLNYGKYQKQCKGQSQGHYQSQENLNADNSHYYQMGYTYPTLNFLLPATDLNLLQTTNTSSILSEEYGRQPTSGKQKKTEHLHPFYKRQILTMTQSRDGLTRTRDKYRVVYTEKQKQLLEEEYAKNHFITENRRSYLVKETNLSERQIKFWFQNRRAKDKRSTKNTKYPKKTQELSPASDVTSLNPDTVQQEVKEHELFLCSKFSSKAPLAKSTISPDFKSGGKTQNEYHSDQFTGSCMFSERQLENQSISPITGSCRFEYLPNCSKNSSPCPTSPQFQCDYPISPSEWAFNKQHSFMLDKIEMSPLYNSLQARFDDRL